jgi:hypothetical protein
LSCLLPASAPAANLQQTHPQELQLGEMAAWHIKKPVVGYQQSYDFGKKWINGSKNADARLAPICKAW